MITPEPEESPWWTLGRRLGLPVWGLGGDFNLMGGQPLLTKPEACSPRDTLLPHNEGRHDRF